MLGGGGGVMLGGGGGVIPGGGEANVVCVMVCASTTFPQIGHSTKLPLCLSSTSKDEPQLVHLTCIILFLTCNNKSSSSTFFRVEKTLWLRTLIPTPALFFPLLHQNQVITRSQALNSNVLARVGCRCILPISRSFMCCSNSTKTIFR